jgi:hypothetical protein
VTSIDDVAEAHGRPATRPSLQACFGVACSQHGRCARYAAVDTSQASPTTIGTCVKDGVYPLFVAMAGYR